MNNIAPPTINDIPSAMNRLDNLLGTLEGIAADIEGRLHLVLRPVSPSPAGVMAGSEPPSDVPLASSLHSFCDRIDDVISRHSSLLNRLHV